MPAPAIENDRGLDTGNAGAVREAVEGQILQVGHVAGNDVDDDIVAPGDQEGRADFGNLHHVVHEAVHRIALVLGELDHEKRFQADTQRGAIDLGMRAPQHAVRTQTLQPLMTAGGGEPDRRGKFFVRQPSIVLQEAQDLEIGSVKLGHVNTSQMLIRLSLISEELSFVHDGNCRRIITMAYRIPNIACLDAGQIESFHKDGFLVLESMLEVSQLDALRAAFPKLFAGQFDTGVYPDEWYWREGMSLPDVTRHMANAWKSDLAVASLVLSADIGRAAAALAGWNGTRLALDTIWWKPPGTKAIALHQDTSFLGYLDPPKTITCWITLDDTRRDAGTIEYVPGSHRWPLTPLPEGFHAPDDYRALMQHAAAAAGVTPPKPVALEVPSGSIVFHAGEIWHGSGPNQTNGQMRRSIGMHLLPDNASFSDRPGGYIIRRYQRTGDPSMDESFFPILWAEDGRRTPWIEGYCETGKREAPLPTAAE